MAEAAVAYFTLLADDGLVQAAEAARADREGVELITRRVVAAGFRPPVDETRAQVGVDVAKLDVAVARATRDNDSASLAAALMLDPATAFRLEAPAPSVSLAPAATGPGVAVVVDTRPTVVAARHRVERMRLELQAARGARLPSVTMQGQGAVLYTSDRVQGTPSNMPSAFVSGALNLTVPLFDPQANANVRIAEAAVGDAQANLEQVTVSAWSAASLAWRQLESTRAILEQAERVSVGTAANLAAVEDRYASGSESPLGVADAQREDALAQVAVIKAHLALDVARVRLLAQLSRVEELGR
jgi:outer membrane protein